MQAVAGVLAAKFRFSGQTCVCANRIFVQSGVYDAFAEKFTAAVRAMRVGVGSEDGVQLGPVINEAAADKFAALLADARDKVRRCPAAVASHLCAHTSALSVHVRVCVYAGRRGIALRRLASNHRPLLRSDRYPRCHQGHGRGDVGDFRSYRTVDSVRYRGRGG